MRTTASSVLRALETSRVRVSEGSAGAVRATRRDHASRCVMRDSLLRVNCGVPIFAQVARYSRTSSTETRALQDETDRHVRRGYCVGSPRHELQTTSNTASAPCIAGCFNSATVAPPTVRSSAANALARERSHVIDTSDSRTRRAVHALLRATGGRHALDEHGDARSMRRPTPVADVDTAVKNLRIADSAVLLLNFREVRRFHFCSTSVAM